MLKYILCVMLLIVLTGCYGLSEQELQLRHQGIIDACYSTIEYDSFDNKQRIDQYLNYNIKRKHLTVSESKIIKKCLTRTIKSKRWSNE